MPEPAPGRWSSAMRLHLPFLLGVPWCLFAGWFELDRALAGRDVAWVYAFEWPLFAVLGTGIWWRQVHEQAPRRISKAPEPAPDPLDTGLVAWQEYLAQLQDADPPGGPPKSQVNARRTAPRSRRQPTERGRSDS
ncbi:MAG: hypothetical protein ABI662_09740 [Dermatophilaceae bacterium]